MVTPISKFLKITTWFIIVFLLSYVLFDFIFTKVENYTNNNVDTVENKVSVVESITVNVWNTVSSIWKGIEQLKSPIKEEYNILLTWMWGEKHSGGSLTDTIILANINTKKNIVSMLSIPRDLYVKFWSWTYSWEWKINEVSFRNKGSINIWSWMIALSSKIEEITGKKIDYYVNINFNSFVNVVDLLWGIEVNVKEDLTDRAYPGKNYSYTTFSVRKGKQIMDGKTALKYARSRHSTDDFDRSLRQQLIIQWVKEKIEKDGILANTMKLTEFYSIFSKNVSTNLDFDTILKLSLFMTSENNEAKTKFITSNLNYHCSEYSAISNCMRWGILRSWNGVKFANMSVLLPKIYGNKEKGDMFNYEEIKEYTNVIFNYQNIQDEQIPIIYSYTWKLSNTTNTNLYRMKSYGININMKKNYTDYGSWIIISWDIDLNSETWTINNTLYYDKIVVSEKSDTIKFLNEILHK